MLVKEKRELWKQKHPSIQTWLNNLRPETQERYITYAYKYFMWIENDAPEPYRGKSPEQLLDMQDLCVRQRERFLQVDLLKTWIHDIKGAYKTKQLIKSVIYSFYASSHVPLPRDVNFKIHGDRPSVNGYLSIEEVKQIILSSNKLYQAVFTIMFQSSMGEEEFTYFNTHSWPQVKKQLDEDKKRIRINLPGRKHKRMRPSGNYFTFFGKDGVTKLKQYLEFRKRLELKETRSKRQPARKRKWSIPPIEEAIFINEKRKPISQEDISSYFKRHCWKLGIVKKVEGDKRIRYRAHAHEMRDTFRTEWNVTDAKPFVAEFFMGHTIDPNNYNKIMKRPEWAEKQYAMAEPYLNILSQEPRKVGVEKVKELEGTLETLNTQLQEELTKRKLYERELKELRTKIDDLAGAREPINEAMERLLKDPEVQRVLLAKLKDLRGKH